MLLRKNGVVNNYCSSAKLFSVLTHDNMCQLFQQSQHWIVLRHDFIKTAACIHSVL